VDLGPPQLGMEEVKIDVSCSISQLTPPATETVVRSGRMTTQGRGGAQGGSQGRKVEVELEAELRGHEVVSRGGARGTGGALARLPEPHHLQMCLVYPRR
jgi:hypothetical protein